MWRHWPPGTTKVSGVPFSGAYKILDVKKDQSGVLLELPACNVCNIKPMVFMKDGNLFIAMPQTLWMDVESVQLVSAYGPALTRLGKREVVRPISNMCVTVATSGHIVSQTRERNLKNHPPCGL